MNLTSRQQRLKFLQRQFEIFLIQDMDALERRIIRELAKTYTANMNIIKGIIADAYEKWAIDGVLTNSALMKYNRLIMMEKQLAGAIKDITGTQLDITRNGLTEAIQNGYLRSRYALESGLNVHTGLYGVNTRLIEANLLNPFDRIGWQSRIQFNMTQNFNKLREIVNQGTLQGYAYDKTAALITDRWDKAFNDAVRIIRTEQHRASNAAANQAFQESQAAAERAGIKIAKVWNHYAVGDFRENHAEQLDGQLADKDGYFTLDGLKAEYPGGFGVAEEDINCKCTVSTAIVDDEDAKLERLNEVPSYDDWVDDNKKKILKG